MTPITRLCALLGAALLSAGPAMAQDTPSRTDTPSNYGVGDPDVFAAKYRAYVDQNSKASNPNLLNVSLGFVKGRSRTFSGTSGAISIDLATGSFAAMLNGLTPGSGYSLVLVDDQDDGITREVLAPLLVTIATVRPLTSSTSVRGTLLLATLGGITVDRIELRDTKGDEVLASGSVSLFQKLLFSGAELVKSDSGRSYAPARPDAALLAFSSIIPRVVDGAVTRTDTPTPTPAPEATTRTAVRTGLVGGGATQSNGNGGQVQLDKLISKGAKLFFEETFEGNGRTCGTCHPAKNNFTIDVPFIASLPNNDPLFVAEFNPDLHDLEKPAVMRQHALILENVDGLEDPVNKFVMRSVPHTLGLQVTMNQDVTQIAPPNNTTPEQMTGWSGDGAPGAGSLRDFATGAVTQHFTRHLQRVPGVDFKLPKNKELDQMEAFQLSLGRDHDFDLSKITFNNADVQAGKNLFNNGTNDPNAGNRCAVCHNNGGANFNATNPPPPPDITFPNRNFNTNVEDVVNPARALLPVPFPIDGGFGALPANLNGSFGNRAFNTPPGVEAADTPPFFHNNIANTLEGVIGFYTGPEFNGPRAPAGRFAFTPTQVGQLTGFLRALNTLQNIDVAQRQLQQVTEINGNPEAEMQNRLGGAFEDISDAITVLGQQSLYPVAVGQLTAASNLIAQAQQPNTGDFRRLRAQQAIDQLNLARSTIASILP